MGRIKSVSRREPCPICGKPDYCFWRERDKEPGLYNLYCKRSTEAKGVIIAGKDGLDYAAIYSADSSTIYESVQQREERTKRRETGEKKQYVERKLTVLDSVTPLSDEKLDQIYRCLLDQLPLFEFHARYLLHEGWDLELIKKHHLSSFPAKNLAKLPYILQEIPSREELAAKIMEKLSLKSLEGVPGAYLDGKGRWTFNAKAGIIFPVYNADGLIYRLRIRMDYTDLPVQLLYGKEGFYYMDKEEKILVTMSGAVKYLERKRILMDFESHRGKYRNFSSYQMDDAAYDAGFVENVFTRGCEAKNNLLFAMKLSDDYSTCWITEGEKKALFANYCIGQPIIAVPGVNSFSLLFKEEHGVTALDILRQRGVKRFVIAYDADREVNQMVMDNQNKLAQRLNEAGFEVYIACWDMKIGKGLDDLLAAGGRPYFMVA